MGRCLEPNGHQSRRACNGSGRAEWFAAGDFQSSGRLGRHNNQISIRGKACLLPFVSEPRLIAVIGIWRVIRWADVKGCQCRICHFFVGLRWNGRKYRNRWVSASLRTGRSSGPLPSTPACIGRTPGTGGKIICVVCGAERVERFCLLAETAAE